MRTSSPFPWSSDFKRTNNEEKKEKKSKKNKTVNGEK